MTDVFALLALIVALVCFLLAALSFTGIAHLVTWGLVFLTLALILDHVPATWRNRG